MWSACSRQGHLARMESLICTQNNAKRVVRYKRVPVAAMLPGRRQVVCVCYQVSMVGERSEARRRLVSQAPANMMFDKATVPCSVVHHTSAMSKHLLGRVHVWHRLRPSDTTMATSTVTQSTASAGSSCCRARVYVRLLCRARCSFKAAQTAAMQLGMMQKCDQALTKSSTCNDCST